MQRVHNFSAGPATLPVEVLQRAQAELLDYQGKGASIMELSHRGAEYTEVNNQAAARFRTLLGVGEEFHVLFLQGGASSQFMMVPFNFLGKNETADYLNTGSWSTKAIKEAKLFGNVHIGYSSEGKSFTSVPKDNELELTPDARYVHYTANNTICGTEYKKEPETGDVPLVCDASSNFLSRPVDMSKYGLIYAGAQKNLGPAGVTIVIIHNDFLEKAHTDNVPTMLKYRTHVEKLFNTPPSFNVYMVNLVLEWLEEKGGIPAMDKMNEEKATLLYGEIDKDDFYKGTAEKDSRSRMNVTFRLPNEDLEKKFITEAGTNGMIGLKGHRSVGGMRASLYNACSLDSVNTLVSFMNEFRRKNG